MRSLNENPLAEAEALCKVPGAASDSAFQEINALAPKLDALLDEVVTFIRRFVVLSLEQAEVVALWVAHTHTFKAAETTPYLAITSAEKRCGKSRLLELLSYLVRRPWKTGRVTAAVLARKIDADQPTLLLDETDAAFKGNKDYAEALRQLLNTGFEVDGRTSLCVGRNFEPHDFSTFCPKAFAGIGHRHLPDTVSDRVIQIRLKRRAPHEQVARLRRRVVRPESVAILRRLETWASAETVEALSESRPNLPDELDDRAQDSAESLLAIADLAGGDWPDRARRSLLGLYGSRPADDSLRGRLLSDLRRLFQGDDAVRFPSAEMCRFLNEDEASSWGGFDDGKGITPRALARLLRDFDIAPKNVKGDDGKVFKGYFTDSFADAFSRYLPPEAPAIRYSATCLADIADSLSFASATAKGGSESTNHEIISKNGHRSAVADESPLRGKDEVEAEHRLKVAIV